MEIKETEGKMCWYKGVWKSPNLGGQLICMQLDYSQEEGTNPSEGVIGEQWRREEATLAPG